jgi:hypothetical protein
MERGEFGLGELNLDKQNIRTRRLGPPTNQRECFHALLKDQKQKLVTLARDLLAVGPSPVEPIWVTKDTDEPGQYIVLEGNRRVAALKMMKNPLLADGTPQAEAFSNLSKEFAELPEKKLIAEVFESREEAKPWIERRHMPETSGVGVQKWHSLTVRMERRDAGDPPTPSLAALEFLDDGSPEFAAVSETILAKSTTVDRVLKSPALKEVLGVTIDKKSGDISFENGNEETGRALLKNVIGGMAEDDFTFSTVRDSDDRKAFLSRFSGQAVKKAAGTSKGDAGKSATTPARAKRAERTRSTLAPGGGDHTIAYVKGTRLSKIYKECRKLGLMNNENAAALLVRVFIELSSEAFLIDKKIALPAKYSGKKTDWADIGITLDDKIRAVMSVVDVTSRTNKQLKQARIALSNKDAHGSIDTLHAYFHNLEVTPSIPALRDAWDTWENYLRLLHAARV